MDKIKDWFEVEHDIEATSEKVIKVFEKWYKRNLVITHGSGHNAEYIFGLPYTSSSDYAALWNCQAEAYLKEDPQWKFRSLAISKGNEILVVLDREDTGNFDDKEIIIGKIPTLYAERIEFIKSYGFENLSQFAREIGDDVSNVHKVFIGKQKPSIEKLLKYAGVLDCDLIQLSYLFYYNETSAYVRARNERRK